MYTTNRESIVCLLAHDYASSTGRQLSTIGRKCSGDSRLVSRLEGGGALSPRVYDRIVQWFSDYWPADSDWPPGIDRPDPAPGSPAAREARELTEAARIGSPLRELDEDGKIADPKAFCAAMPVVVLRATFDQVIAQYADGRPKADKSPRRGTNAFYVLEALVRAGDSRFVTRAAKRTKEEVMNRQIASKFGLAS